jgi:class 3 adenylate cyclase
MALNLLDHFGVRRVGAVTGRGRAGLLIPGGGLWMAKLPTGTVTFLFSDLESSTRLWEEHTEAMKCSSHPASGSGASSVCIPE